MSGFTQTLNGLSRSEIKALAPALLERLSPGGTQKRNMRDYSGELQTRDGRRSTLPIFPENGMSESQQLQPADRQDRETRTEAEETLRYSRHQWPGTDTEDESFVTDRTQRQQESDKVQLRLARDEGKDGAASVLRPGEGLASPGSDTAEMERISEYFRRDAMRYDGGFKRY